MSTRYSRSAAAMSMGEVNGTRTLGKPLWEEWDPKV